MDRHRAMRRTSSVFLAATVAVALSTSIGAASVGKAHKPKPKTHKYVTSSVGINLQDTSSKRYGFDLDGDKRVDNQFGRIFQALASQGFDFPTTIQVAITGGQTVTLETLKTKSLTDAKTASMRFYDGVPKVSPTLTGGGKFKVDPNALNGTPLKGSINKGVFQGSGGTIPLQLALFGGADPIALTVIDANVKATCTANACVKAKFGGAITVKSLDEDVIPKIAQAMTEVVAQTCSAASPDTCSDEAKQILNIFDQNNDYIISTDEVLNNSIIQILFKPDLDLFKANGKPGTDGTADSISIGFAYTANNAKFALP